MGQAIFRLPSKGTQYGYAEYSFEHDADGSDDAGYALGVQYKHFVDNFQRGEAFGQAELRSAKPAPTLTPRPSALKAVAATDDRRDSETYAGLSQPDAVDLITKELGASVYDEDVDEQTPEWEAPPPPASDDDWDF